MPVKRASKSDISVDQPWETLRPSSLADLSSPIAANTGLSGDFEEQAEPVETAIPKSSKARSITMAGKPGNLN